MKPLRVLHVIPSVSVHDGGPSRAIALMERSLTDAGIVVTTLTTDHDSAGRRTAPPGLPPCANGARRIYARKWTDPYKVAPGLAAYLLRHVREHDVVHIHALFSFAPTAAALTARALGVPYVVRPLGTLGGYGLAQRRRRLKRVSLAALEGPILRHAAAVHFTSRMEAEEACAIGIPIRSAIVPIGIEADRLAAPAASPLAGELGAVGHRRVVLFLSRIDPKKNLETVIDALASSERLRRDAVLAIAGTGRADYLAELQARVHRLGLADCVRWLGHVDGERKSAAFAAADVFVLPSHSENFGIAAVEAMLAGLPCVLTPGVAVAAEAAAAGGAIVSGATADEVASALQVLVDDAPARADMARSARAFAQRTYSVDAMARGLIDLYQAAIAGRVRAA